MFDQFKNGYYATGAKVGKAWNAGAAWMKKSSASRAILQRYLQ